MPSIASERATVQNPLVEYVQEIGWAYVSPEQALTLRRGESGTLFYQTLRDKLVSLNPGVVTVSNVDEVIARIESVRNTIEGNAEILAWLRGERSIYVESEKRQRNVVLIDFAHPAENVFQVTDEWQYTNGKYRNRADVVFVINGIPVALVETKSALKREGIDEGIAQIRRYHRETPELVTAPQIFDVTHLIDFYYGVTWNLDRKNVFNWKDEEKGNFERKVKRFFARERFLRFLESWIVFYKKDDELRKIVLRQHQIVPERGKRKVVRRLRPEIVGHCGRRQDFGDQQWRGRGQFLAVRPRPLDQHVRKPDAVRRPDAEIGRADVVVLEPQPRHQLLGEPARQAPMVPGDVDHHLDHPPVHEFALALAPLVPAQEFVRRGRIFRLQIHEFNLACRAAVLKRR